MSNFVSCKDCRRRHCPHPPSVPSTHRDPDTGTDHRVVRLL